MTIDAKTSAQSWVSIWLGCMDARFNRNTGAASALKVSKRNTKFVGDIQPQEYRHGTSLHQNYAGHGFNPHDAIQFYLPDTWQHGGSDLGASPRERRTIHVANYHKRR